MLKSRRMKWGEEECMQVIGGKARMKDTTRKVV
jgi:hypothetical protein